jgi:Protein of unknown function (DUF3341)
MSTAANTTTTAQVHTEDLYGLVAEFATVDGIMAAAERAKKAGYKRMESYTPFAIEGLDDAVGHQPTKLGWVVFWMGVTGFATGFFMQWYSNTQFYPLNIGGKPLNSWPNWIVITFECTILFSAFTAGLFMLGRNGLPRPYHSIFNTPGFERATRDRFFLCIEATDDKFDLGKTKKFMETFQAERVSEVER